MFTRGTAGRVIAIADIDSGSAGVAIVSQSAKAPIEILAVERVVIPAEHSADRSLTAIASTLSDAASRAMASYGKIGRGPVQETYVIVRSPWARSKISRGLTVFDEDTRITSRRIADLATKILEHEKEFDRAKILEASVVRVELNGYPTGQPEGKTARSLGVTALLSECEPTTKAAIQESLAPFFPSPILFRSDTRALLSVVRETETFAKDLFIVSMASESTSMLAVRDGVAAEQISLPEGVHSIVRRIAGGTLPAEVFTLMRLLAKDQAEEGSAKSIATAVTAAEPELTKLFGEALAKLSISRRMPNELVLVTHPDLASWLLQFFSRIDFAQFTATSRPFAPRVLDHDHTHRFVIPSDGSMNDPALSIAAALVNIEKNEG